MGRSRWTWIGVAVVALAAGGCGNRAKGGSHAKGTGDGGSAMDGGTVTDGGTANDGGVTETGALPSFPRSAPWTQDVSGDSVDSHSSAIIGALVSAGGFGGGGGLRIDFSMVVLHAGATTPMRTFTPTSDFYTPDCDHVAMPVPPGGALEGETGYACTTNGDCHLLVVDDATRTLYEMWRANIQNGTFHGGCLAVWDLTKVYPPSGRGEQCTSADAAGFPIAPLLFTADEVASGHIDHAIRFILPNNRIRNGSYVHPASHSTGATSGGTSAPPYGVRLRLRPNFPVASLPNAGAKVVARALMKYGMFLADGGNIALTAESDRFTTAKWPGLLGSHDLTSIHASDFQVVDLPTPTPYTGNCVRN